MIEAGYKQILNNISDESSSSKDKINLILTTLFTGNLKTQILRADLLDLFHLYKYTAVATNCTHHLKPVL